MGGFTADAKGLVYGLIPDPRQLSDVTSIPYAIQTATLDGKATTVYTFPKGSIMSSVRADADSIYFVGNGYKVDNSILKIPRTGGTPTPVYTPTTGTIGEFVMDDANVYFAEDQTLYSVSKAGGTPKPLGVRKGVDIHNLAVDEGTLFWGEQPQGTLDATDTTMWKMTIADGTATTIGVVPAKQGSVNQVGISEGLLVFSTIENDSSQQLYSLATGGSPNVIDSAGGNPMVVVGTDVYYNSYAGLKHASLSLTSGPAGAPTVITSASVPFMSAIAVSDKEIFYAAETCVFRQNK